MAPLHGNSAAPRLPRSNGNQDVGAELLKKKKMHTSKYQANSRPAVDAIIQEKSDSVSFYLDPPPPLPAPPPHLAKLEALLVRRQHHPVHNTILVGPHHSTRVLFAAVPPSRHPRRSTASQGCRLPDEDVCARHTRPRGDQAVVL